MFKGLLGTLRYSEDIRASERFLEEQFESIDSEIDSSLYPHYDGQINENGYLINRYRTVLENSQVKSAFENAPDYMDEKALHPHLILFTFIKISSYIPQRDVAALAQLIAGNRVFRTSIRVAEKARVSQVLLKIGEILNKTAPENREEQLSRFGSNGLLNEIKGIAHPSALKDFNDLISSNTQSRW